jgi:hypothetical protein
MIVHKVSEHDYEGNSVEFIKTLVFLSCKYIVDNPEGLNCLSNDDLMMLADVVRGNVEYMEKKHVRDKP